MARYDDKFRASAVVMLQAAGWPEREGALSQVAKHLDVPAMTLGRWAKGESNPPPNEIVDEKRVELSDLLEKALRAALGSLSYKLEEASYRDTATAIGIFTDKLQLLNDKPTQNVNAQIAFVRSGVSTLPEHLAPGPAPSIAGEAEV